jgi:26S proteasome regulatory subunit T3
VRILSTLNRELLKPSSSVALHRHSNALVDILPPEADSSIAMLGDHEKPDVTYADIGGNDIQKQEIREAVELPLSNPGLYAQARPTSLCTPLRLLVALRGYWWPLCCTLRR